MKNLIKNIYFVIGALSIMSGWGLISCKDDGFNIPGEEYSSDIIKVSASSLQAYESRGDYSYIAYGPVESGDFVVSYQYYYDWRNSGLGTRYIRYRYGEVKFGQIGDEKTGFINISPSGIKELVWGSSGGQGNGIFFFSGTKPNFFMDNVPITPNLRQYMNVPTGTRTIEQDSVVNLNTMEDPTRFNAAVLDSLSGRNDLLWGEIQASQNTNPIHFNLLHRMCQFNLAVEVDNRGESAGQFTIDLSHATVYITNLQQKPIQYWRNYGDLIFNTPPELSDLYMVGDENLNTSPSSDLYWSCVYRDGQRVEGENIEEKFYGIETYYTENFVIADQSLVEGVNWPKIVIKIPRNDVNDGTDLGGLPDGEYIEFSGGMPHGIYFNRVDENGNFYQDPDMFRFWKGTKINLKVKIDPSDWSLEFVPVMVEQWVDKGSYGPEAKQAGIHTADDLYNLIDYWNSEPLVEFNLSRYGYFDGTKWIFQFQAPNLEFELEKIIGQMQVKEEYSFSFDFRGRREYLIVPGRETPSLLDRTAGQNTLYEIVTGGYNTGIKQSDFEDLISAYQSYGWKLGRYGDYDNETWVFNLNENLVFQTTEEVEGMMVPPQGDDVDFTFNYNGNTVTIAGKSYEVEEFVEILSSRAPGVYFDSDFLLLIDVYSQANMLGLEDFAKQDTPNEWTIYFRRNNLTLDMADIQGSMQLSTSDEIPFKFDFLKYSVKVNNYDGTTTTLTGVNGQNILYEIVSGPKMTGLSSKADIESLITQYTTNPSENNRALTQFGYFDSRTDVEQWNFLVTGELTIQWEDFFGKMPIEDGNPGYFLSLGDWAVTIEEVPEEYSKSSTIVLVGTNNGNWDFYKIMTGTYEPLETPTPDEP